MRRAERANGGAGGRERCLRCALSDAGAGTAGEISFWQTLRIPLELHGSSVAPNAPIISGKDGILRVYVEPDPTSRARALSAVLATTFNFPFVPEQVTPGTSYSVTVSDQGGCATSCPLFGRHHHSGERAPGQAFA